MVHLPLEWFTARYEAMHLLNITISVYSTCIRCAHQRGSRQNIAMTFGMEKLEWCDYQMVKKSDNTITRFDTIHERDIQTHRQMDKHCMTV